VLKVLFSALVAAMLGAFWLDRAGALDLRAVYLPETFAAPPALGGALFGAGLGWPDSARARRAWRPRPAGATGSP